MTSLTLYEITSEIKELLSDVIAAGGEITDEQWAALEKYQGNLAVKTDGYRKIIRNFDGLIETIHAEEACLRERRKTIENAVARMKDRIFGAMKVMDVREIEGACGGFRIQKSPPSVEIGNPHELPDEYVDIEILRKPKRDEIKKALQAGEKVKGAVLKQGEHLRIV